MDHNKLFALLKAHELILGLPQFANIRARLEADLASIDAALAPKAPPAPVAKVIPASTESKGERNETNP